jgi:hypothetical protein
MAKRKNSANTTDTIRGTERKAEKVRNAVPSKTQSARKSLAPQIINSARPAKRHTPISIDEDL